MDASDIVLAAVTNLTSEANTIVPAALVIGFTLLAVRRGWGYVKGFTK